MSVNDRRGTVRDGSFLAGPERSRTELRKILRTLGFRVSGRSRGELLELLVNAERGAARDLAFSSRKLRGSERYCSRCGDQLPAGMVRSIGREGGQRCCLACREVGLVRRDPRRDTDEPPRRRSVLDGDEIVREGARYFLPIGDQESLLPVGTRLRVSTPRRRVDGTRVIYAAVGGEIRGPFAVKAVRVSLLARSAEWEREGPWGGSLAWLERQSRPEPWERCPRCNWPRRFFWLIGRDDGGEPRACLGRASPNSTGARLPLRACYEESAPLGYDRVGRGQVCVLCAGKGFLEPRAFWNSGPRLGKRPAVGLEDADDLYDIRIEFGALDDDGRLSSSPSRLHGHVEPKEALSDTGSVGDVPAWVDAAPSSRASEEVRLFSHILRLAFGGDAAARSVDGWEAAESRSDLNEPTPILEPLALRQFLIDVRAREGGRQPAWRERLVRRRDAVIFELFSSGFPVERVGRAVGLKKSQIYDVRGVREVLEVASDNSESLISYWTERGYSTREIAIALGVSARTVQRNKKKLLEELPDFRVSEQPLAGSSVMRFIAAAFAHAPTLFELHLPSDNGANSLTIDDFRDGIPIDIYQRMGKHLLQAPPKGEAYHSWRPQDEPSGLNEQAPRRHTGLVHPHLYALLSDTTADPENLPN